MKKKLRSTFLLESLEARLLFSADLAPLPVDGGVSRPEADSGLEISLRPDNGGVQAADANEQLRQEIIFVDEGVDDYQRLIFDLESQLEQGRQFDIVALDSDHDGIAQISAYLKQHQDVDAVHVISHGTDGEAVLGNSRLNTTTLDGYAEAIEGWQRALSKDADLLFYGCNLAAGDEGLDLINTITLLTGADVAASDDVTGSAKLGGDWVLEYGKGEIETAVAVNSATQQSWNGVLATFTVNTTADTIDDNLGDGNAEDAAGNTSLRAAIMEANDLGGTHTIILGADTYILTKIGSGEDNAATGDLDITADITITGAGAGVTVIDANSLDRVFHVKGNAANLTLTDLTITGGNINNKGGGIFVEHQLARLTATRVIVTGNIADDGAGIFNDGIMTLTDVVISNNGDATTDEGGGIHNKETAILERVTISGNHADKVGGKGGGIHNDNTAWNLSLTNVTISGNSAEDKGGGLHTENPVTIVNSTITLNSATTGGGIHQISDTVDIKNTIVAENLAGLDPDVGGTFNSQGNNLIGDKGAAIGFNDGVNGDQVGTGGSPVDPMLGSLWDNGGFTPTHALLAGSPTIDPVGMTGAPPLDQRGANRDGLPDIGAFEFGAAIGNNPGSVTIDNTTPAQGDTLTASVIDPDGATGAITYQWYRGAAAIGGATSVTYTTVQADVGSAITVTATYTDDLGAGESPTSAPTAAVTNVNDAPTADPGGPYTISEGDTLNLDASASADPDGTIVSWEWDIGNNGSFEKSGETVSFSWAELNSAGVNDNGTVDVTLRVTDNDGAQTLQTFQVTVDNTAPTLTVSGNLTTDDGAVYTLNLSKTDPGDDSMTWTINWGDGTVDSVAGSASTATHTYTGEGLTYNITVSANDEDGSYHDNQLLVADSIGDKIVRFAAGSNTVLGEFANGDLNSIDGAVIGPDGMLYAGSFGAGEIKRYDPSTGVRDLSFLASDGLVQVAQMAFGPDGLLYVVNSNSHQILTFDTSLPSPTASVFIDGAGSLTNPMGLLFHPDGSIYVGGYASDNVVRYDASGNNPVEVANAADGINGAQFLALGPDGAVFIASTTNNRIYHYDGSTVRLFASGGGVDGPLGVTFGPDGYLYVTSELNGTAEVFRYDTSNYVSSGYTPVAAEAYIDSGLTNPRGLVFIPSHQVTVNPVNDAPTATNLTSTSSYNEGDAAVAITDIVVSDTDTGETITATLTLNDTVAGSLSANDGATYDGGTGEWTITDTVANVNIALANLVFNPNVNNDVDTTISVEIDDGDEDASGPLTGNITLDVTPINDAPTVVTNAPLNVPEEATRTITSAYLETTDPDNSPDQIIYTLTSLPSGGWVRLNGTPLTLGQTFTQDDINNNRVTYRDDDDGETTSFQMTVSDGNTTLPAFSFSINGQPINDAPVVSAPGSALNATEQIGLAIHGTGFGVSDLDEAGAGALATLTVGEGTISVVVGNSGVSIDSGDGTGTVTLSGSIVQLNALFTGTSTGTITYLNNSDNPSSNTTLTVTVNDQGNTGSDPGLTGDGSSEEGSNSVTINITPINDAPVLGNNNLTITEGATVALDSSMLSATDVDHPDPSLTFNVSGVTAGHFAFSIDTATPITSFDQSDITAGTVVFVHDGNEASPSYSVSVTDGTDSTAAIPANITFSNQNDAPTLGNNSLNIDEGATVIFDSSMLSATDVDNPDGGLTFNISAVSAGQFERVSTGLVMTVFTQADITSGEVRFVHDGSQTAPSYNVSVTDGSASVGPTPAVINFTNINDPGTVTIDNLTPAQGDTLTASVSDADGATGAILYQWYRGAAAIGGATSATYTTVQADVGSAITVTATYTDDLGAGESPTSAATAAVTNVNDPGTVTIDNTTPAQGDTLTANVIDPDGASGAISYQWFSDGAAIGGALGKTYTTVQADVGTVITVTADYSDDLSTVESLTSAGTAAVTNVNDTPVTVNDNLNATEDHSMTITSVIDLIGNDFDIDGDTLTLSGFSQPANGMLVDNADGTLGYTPAGDFCGIDSFTYTISDGNSGTADGTAMIVVAPVGDTPQVTNVSTTAEVQSGLIFINRNAGDGPEVSHFKISGISNGSLYLADGVTGLDNGDFISVAQGQAGVRYTPAEGSTADGSFNVESSQDGVSVALQSGIATSIITVLTTAPPPAASEPSPPLAEPEPVTDEDVVEEEAEATDDLADETDVSANADDIFSVAKPQSYKAPSTAKPSFISGIADHNPANSDSDDKTLDRSTLLSPQSLKMLLEAQNLGELKTALGKLNITTLSSADYELVRNSLDAIKEEMGKEILLGKTVLGSAMATTVGLSAGYVVWMLKGGSLLASVLSSLPAWQLADPLAILVGKKDDDDDDDESLETIIKEGSGRDKDKKRKASELNNLRKDSAKR